MFRSTDPNPGPAGNLVWGHRPVIVALCFNVHIRAPRERLLFVKHSVMLDSVM